MPRALSRRKCALNDSIFVLTQATAAQCQCQRRWLRHPPHNVRKTTAFTIFNCPKVFGDLFICKQNERKFPHLFNDDGSVSLCQLQLQNFIHDNWRSFIVVDNVLRQP